MARLFKGERGVFYSFFKWFLPAVAGLEGKRGSASYGWEHRYRVWISALHCSGTLGTLTSTYSYMEKRDNSAYSVRIYHKENNKYWYEKKIENAYSTALEIILNKHESSLFTRRLAKCRAQIRQALYKKHYKSCEINHLLFGTFSSRFCFPRFFALFSNELVPFLSCFYIHISVTVRW